MRSPNAPLRLRRVTFTGLAFAFRSLDSGKLAIRDKTEIKTLTTKPVCYTASHVVNVGNSRLVIKTLSGLGSSCIHLTHAPEVKLSINQAQDRNLGCGSVSKIWILTATTWFSRFHK